MDRPRFFDVRTSGLPEAVGLCSTNLTAIAAIVNEAQQRLMMDPMAPDEGWWGGWARYAFNVAYPNQFIYTPREVARIILMDVCKKPTRLRNEFYEFLEYTKGLQPEGCCNGCGQNLMAYERETVPTLHPFIGNKTLRFYPNDSRDVGKRVLVQGEDANGKIVYGTSLLTGKTILGETVTLDLPFVDTANTFSLITGLQKDPTMGDITAYQVDTTGTETALSTIEPSEMTTQYRKHFINGIPSYCCGSTTIQLLALCKLDFIPVQSDSDYLSIPNIPALIEECMAVRYSRMDTPGAAQLGEMRHQKALRLLFGQLDHHMGKEKTAIARSIFGGNPLVAQPF